MKQNQHGPAWAALIGAAMLLSCAQAARAEDTTATQLQGIEVTGSRIPRVDRETSNPLLTLSARDIAATGATTLGDVLQSLPIVSGSLINSQYNNPASGGEADVGLRGLTSSRTLLLIDGQRLVSADVNQIPLNLIERVEILKQGASAVYGSDAIGGVVNIITRKKLKGFEASAYYGKSGQGDDGTFQTDLSGGLNYDGGNAVFGLSYNRNEAIHASDRDFAAFPYGIYQGAVYPLANGSVYTPTGFFQLTGSALPGYGCPAGSPYLTRKTGAAGAARGDYRCFNDNPYPDSRGPSDLYNYQPENLLLSPTSHASAFALGDYALTDDIKLFAEGFYTHTHSYNQLAPEAFDLSSTSLSLNQPVQIDSNSVYNPFAQNISTFYLRTAQAGDRSTTFNTDTYQATAGLKGVVLERYSWNVVGTYGSEQNRTASQGYLNISTLPQALGPSFTDANGVATCGTRNAPIAGCTPIDVLGTTGTNIGALAVGTRDHTGSTLITATADINGDLLDLWAGPLSFELGYEFRRSQLNFTPDPLAAAFQLSESNETGTSGSYQVHEAYAEVLLPVARDLPFLYRLNFDFGFRYSSYSSFSSTENNKFAIEYRPIKDLLLRATYADIFRAPTISDLYGGTAQDAPTYTDPCNGLGGAANPTPGANPQGVADACQNVSTNGRYQQFNSQASAVISSNRQLQPETGYTSDFGLVYSPHWYQPLSIETDFWHYTVRNAISVLSLQDSLNACFNYDVYCQNINRDANSGQLTHGIEPETNSDRFDTTGLDFGIHLDYPHTALGSFHLRVDTTYLQKFDYKILAAGATIDESSLAGQYDSIVFDGGYPRLRGNTSLSWDYGGFGVTVLDRYLSNVNETVPEYDGTTCPSGSSFVVVDAVPSCNRKVGSANYVDLSGSYHFAKLNTDITLGINDLFQEGAQLAYSAPVPDTILSLYSVVGRFFYAKVTVKFR